MIFYENFVGKSWYQINELFKNNRKKKKERKKENLFTHST